MKEALGDKVEKVAVSARLTDAPACITTEGPLSLEMEKVLQKGPEGAPRRYAQEPARARAQRQAPGL